MNPSRFSKADRTTAISVEGQGSAEPRWPVLLAVVALVGLQAALPSTLLMGGSRWIPVGSVLVLLVPTIILHRNGVHSLDQVLGYILNGVVTLTMIWSLILLIESLPAHIETPQQL